MRSVRTWMGVAVLGWAVVAVLGLPVAAARAALVFTPATGYAASTAWSGGDAAHFAVTDGAFYLAGVTDVGNGQQQLVIRQFDGSTTTSIAASDPFASGAYYADALTAVATPGAAAVYWVQAQAFGAGGYSNLYRTAFDGATWSTTKLVDEAQHFTFYSLSAGGGRVLGTGLSPAGSNAAFFLDAGGAPHVLAELPALASGGAITPSLEGASCAPSPPGGSAGFAYVSRPPR